MTDLAFPLATKLTEKLGSFASEQICLAWGVKADLKKLQSTMSTIKDVLLDAEQKQAHNQQIRSWLRQLKDVFLDAEDLLDEFECEALRREVVRRFFSRSNPIAFRLRVGHEIKEIRGRLDELKSNKAIFDSLTSIDHHGGGGDHHERVNVTHSFLRASKVIGRESRVHGNMELEDFGELYFKDLWARYFFQNVIDFHVFYIFDMHHLIHDLVQSVAQDECFIVKNANTIDISENVRHLTVLEAGQNVSTTLQKLNQVRTIETCEIDMDESFMCTCFSRFKYLRVGVLPKCSLQVLPSSIGSLKHLRYLAFNLNEAITKLPNAICRLQSLQTLNFVYCENLQELPRDISKLISLTSLFLTTKQTSFTENGVGCLKSLRFLNISRCSNLTSLPRETSYLAALRTLWIADCKQLDLGNVNYQGTPLRLILRNS
ncbi:hypothetical protein PRUPE_7G033700 [Prunus persica]|uniref:Uncharacterized protein n=1 Tax=Prunus persica TaxID=3760 RepID=A0A251N658_PRUPE|nr:hypothetical protein PRUPE_7G033700 [Prunus persica]